MFGAQGSGEPGQSLYFPLGVSGKSHFGGPMVTSKFSKNFGAKNFMRNFGVLHMSFCSKFSGEIFADF